MNMIHGIDGLVLAGGRGERMNGIDKGLLPFSGTTLAEYMGRRLARDCDRVLISHNRNRDRYATMGFDLCTDLRADFQGPLAGIEAALSEPGNPLLLIAPCDMPRLPDDYARRLLEIQQRGGFDIVYAVAGGRAHYLCALLKRELLHDLGEYLDTGGRAVHRWYARHNTGQCTFEDDIENFNETAPASADNGTDQR